MLPVGAFGSGLLAGLGIALPLGAIGVLIIREAVESGMRTALAAACGVALVDFGYALLAVVVGQGLADALAGYERAIQLVGAVALAVVVVRGVSSLRVGAGTGPGAGAGAGGRPDLPSGHVLAKFVALTAINPMTAVYFVALTAGLSERLTGGGSGLAFALGVLVGSLSWQLVLAVGGSLLGSRMSERIRIAVSLAGYAIVAAYALRLALGG